MSQDATNGAPGIATSNKKLLGAPGRTTRSKSCPKYIDPAKNRRKRASSRKCLPWFCSKVHLKHFKCIDLKGYH